eukprot:354064-Chlamydomonas_euryale.AAC.6
MQAGARGGRLGRVMQAPQLHLEPECHMDASGYNVQPFRHTAQQVLAAHVTRQQPSSSRVKLSVEPIIMQRGVTRPATNWHNETCATGGHWHNKKRATCRN